MLCVKKDAPYRSRSLVKDCRLRSVLFLAFALCLISTSEIRAEGYANISQVLWSKDETRLILLYGNSFDAGSYDQMDVYDVLSGKLIKRYTYEYNFDSEHDRQIRKSKNRQLSALRQSLGLLPTAWLVPDPNTYAYPSYPSHWPSTKGGRYESYFDWFERRFKIILKTYGNDEEQTGFRIYVQTDLDPKPRLLTHWRRPKDYSGKSHALGAIGTSPTEQWICVLLRRFDYGFESSDAVPVPLFFLKRNLETAAP